METKQQRLIREALEHSSGERERQSPEASDPKRTTSLHDQALMHTDDDYVPRTLTPHEWEEYYKQVGVPRSHRRHAIEQARTGKRSGRLWALLRRLTS